MQLQDSLFQSLEIAEPKLIPDDEQPFTVTAFDANHCPGKFTSHTLVIPSFHVITVLFPDTQENVLQLVLP